MKELRDAWQSSVKISKKFRHEVWARKEKMPEGGELTNKKAVDVSVWKLSGDFRPGTYLCLAVLAALAKNFDWFDLLQGVRTSKTLERTQIEQKKQKKIKIKTK